MSDTLIGAWAETRRRRRLRHSHVARDGVVRVAVRGELDIATVPLLDVALRRAQSRAEVVVLDLRGLEFVDSSGAQLMLEATRRAQVAGGCLLIGSVTAEVERVLTLLGVYHLLEIVDEHLTEAGTVLSAATPRAA